jgi:hypothetical protein
MVRSEQPEPTVVAASAGEPPARAVSALQSTVGYLPGHTIKYARISMREEGFDRRDRLWCGWSGLSWARLRRAAADTALIVCGKPARLGMPGLGRLER